MSGASKSREKILEIFRNEKEILSGEWIAQRVGISRVSVWKHIRKLQEMGYDIEATAKGYRLKNRPDALHPWEFPDRQGQIHYFPEVESTMEIARQMARSGCPSLTVVVADSQTKGRGRLRRQWFSEPGGLYFTVVTRPELPPQESGRINLAASLTMAEVLSDLFGIDASVKWPNDILVAERKIVGILSEMDAEADRVLFVNVGIGVNVNNNPTAIEPRATSVRLLLGREVSRRDLLEEFLSGFEKRLFSGLGPELVACWKQRNATLGRSVRVVTLRETVEGVAEDVDENGALIVRTGDNRLQTVVYGDCFHN